MNNEYGHLEKLEPWIQGEGLTELFLCNSYTYGHLKMF